MLWVSKMTSQHKHKCDIKPKNKSDEDTWFEQKTPNQENLLCRRQSKFRTIKRYKY